MFMINRSADSAWKIPADVEACVEKFRNALTMDLEDREHYGVTAQLINYQMISAKSLDTFKPDLDNLLASVQTLSDQSMLDTDVVLMERDFCDYAQTWKTKLSSNYDSLFQSKVTWDILQLRSTVSRKALSGSENKTRAVVLKAQTHDNYVQDLKDVTILGESFINNGYYRVKDSNGANSELPAIGLLRSEMDASVQKLMLSSITDINEKCLEIKTSTEKSIWIFLEKYLKMRSQNKYLDIENESVWGTVVASIQRLNKIPMNNNVDKYLSIIRQNVEAFTMVVPNSMTIGSVAAFEISEAEAVLLNEILNTYNVILQCLEVFLQATENMPEKNNTWIMTSFTLIESYIMKRMLCVSNLDIFSSIYRQNHSLYSSSGTNIESDTSMGFGSMSSSMTSIMSKDQHFHETDSLLSTSSGTVRQVSMTSLSSVEHMSSKATSITVSKQFNGANNSSGAKMQVVNSGAHLEIEVAKQYSSSSSQATEQVKIEEPKAIHLKPTKQNEISSTGAFRCIDLISASIKYKHNSFIDNTSAQLVREYKDSKTQVKKKEISTQCTGAYKEMNVQTSKVQFKQETSVDSTGCHKEIVLKNSDVLIKQEKQHIETTGSFKEIQMIANKIKFKLDINADTVQFQHAVQRDQGCGCNWCLS